MWDGQCELRRCLIITNEDGWTITGVVGPKEIRSSFARRLFLPFRRTSLRRSVAGPALCRGRCGRQLEAGRGGSKGGVRPAGLRSQPSPPVYRPETPHAEAFASVPAIGRAHV